ncbi:MAG: type II toxin-antitoxin system VapC family toxin [Pseudomonadota bacterium]
MYLVDSSVWINHLRASDEALIKALRTDLVSTHPYVVGELALGSLKNRMTFIEMMKNLPSVKVADNEEVLDMIDARGLFSRGLGWIDAHLLASSLITGGASLWTDDKRLGDIASELGVAGRYEI